MVFRCSFYLVIPTFILLYHGNTIYADYKWVVLVATVAIAVAIFPHVPVVARARRRFHPMRERQLYFLVLFGGFALALWAYSKTRKKTVNPHLASSWTIIIAYLCTWATSCLYYLGFASSRIVRKIYCAFDTCAGSLILFVLFVISLLSTVLSPLQTTLLFQQDGVLHRLEIARATAKADADLERADGIRGLEAKRKALKALIGG
eukprot:SAG31_NODE_6684_length_1925_cov_1.533406_3_plen_204_part_01